VTSDDVTSLGPFDKPVQSLGELGRPSGHCGPGFVHEAEKCPNPECSLEARPGLRVADKIQQKKELCSTE